uniref:Reverse transcriptase domain-containing protein n=1 Tax=Strigamia maritima TaxID=126957 RepID=T1IJY2_STRMM
MLVQTAEAADAGQHVNQTPCELTSNTPLAPETMTLQVQQPGPSWMSKPENKRSNNGGPPGIQRNQWQSDQPIWTKPGMTSDTGSKLSLLGYDTYRSLWPDAEDAPIIRPMTTRLSTYVNSPVAVKGQINVEIHDLHLKTNYEHLATNQVEIQHDDYHDVFQPGLGLYKAKNRCNNRIKIFPPRPVPIALLQHVDKALDELIQQAVLAPIKFNEWATPLVVLAKKGSGIRICGDYRATINQALQPDPYPLPKIPDIITRLPSARYFTKLDITQAYQQRLLDYSSSLLVAVYTHRGLFRVTRMPFGITREFQRIMKQEFKDITTAEPYQNNMLISMLTKQEHYHMLLKILQRCRDIGFRLRLAKCEFMVESNKIKGHKTQNSQKWVAFARDVAVDV